MKVVANEAVKSVVINAVVLRCGCTETQKAQAYWHGRTGETCPHPRAIEDRGTIVRWHRNPMRQAWNVVRRAFGKV